MVVKIKYTKRFLKNFRIRIAPKPNLVKRFDQRFELFIHSPRDPMLKNHKLTGTKKDLRAFSITGDIRVVYEETSSREVILLDIGTHNQVY